MSGTKVIAVLGATGAQGGGLAQAILDDPDGGYSCRAVTRDPGSDVARDLTARGAEVVRADLDDESSLIDAFQGAHGAYCMTNFFEHFSADKELEQAAKLANAVKAAGVSHAIWSTQPDSRDWVPLEDNHLPTLQGRYKVPHWDAKGEANRFFIDSGVPTTFLHLPTFWDNFMTLGAPQRPQRGPDGVLAIRAPLGDMKLPGIAAEDIGRCAYGIFKKGPAFAGKTVGVASEHLTGAEFAARLSEALGEQVRFRHVPVETLRESMLPGADLVANMFQLTQENLDSYCAPYDVALSRSLNPRLQSFVDWLAANVHLLRMPAGSR
jgi:uncharacterized protein YbjT (DUF2867 family)